MGRLRRRRTQVSGSFSRGGVAAREWATSRRPGAAFSWPLGISTLFGGETNSALRVLLIEAFCVAADPSTATSNR